jgi:UDP-GlcNAc3NAcA epimerase
VTLRDETEWIELVELGWNTVTPPVDADLVAQALREGLTRGPGRPGRPYGDGAAADAIVRVLMDPGLSLREEHDRE